TTRQNHVTSIAAPPVGWVSWHSSGPPGLPTNRSKDYEIGSAGLRRLFVLPLVASVVLGLAGPAPAATTSDTAPVAAPQQLTAAARGLVLSGLRPGSAGERCRDKYVLVVSGACTHGPDAAPPGVDVRVRRPLLAAGDSSGGGTTAAASSTVPCYGDGSSGPRVQAIYAHASDVSDRYGQV